MLLEFCIYTQKNTHDGLTRAGAPRGPVLEDGPPDDVVAREEAPDVRVEAVVPVVAQHHVHALWVVV